MRTEKTNQSKNRTTRSAQAAQSADARALKRLVAEVDKYAKETRPAGMYQPDPEEQIPSTPMPDEPDQAEYPVDSGEHNEDEDGGKS